eukprot:363764-Chlamydomonas_euryale.AAC.5
MCPQRSKTTSSHAPGPSVAASASLTLNGTSASCRPCTISTRSGRAPSPPSPAVVARRLRT